MADSKLTKHTRRSFDGCRPLTYPEHCCLCARGRCLSFLAVDDECFSLKEIRLRSSPHCAFASDPRYFVRNVGRHGRFLAANSRSPDRIRPGRGGRTLFKPICLAAA